MHNLPYGFDIYLVNVKIIRQIFVVFSEKLNFKNKEKKFFQMLSKNVCNEVQVMPVTCNAMK